MHNYMSDVILVISAFSKDNEIDGPAFCELTEEEIKQMVKPLGVVKRIIRLQKFAGQPVSMVREFLVQCFLC